MADRKAKVRKTFNSGSNPLLTSTSTSVKKITATLKDLKPAPAGFIVYRGKIGNSNIPGSKCRLIFSPYYISG
jgi:hypothetical protein